MISFSRNITVSGRTISAGSPVFIIAEAGVNHGGNMDVARQLIDIAAESGADAVKFQAFRTESLILRNVDKAPYQQNTTEAKESQYDMLKKLELKRFQYVELKEYCAKRNILFLITPFDEDSLKELEEIGVEAYKIASTDTTNLPFLKKVAQTGKPVFFSTGMSYMDEVKTAVEEIGRINPQLVILHCTANYPIRNDEVNLNVINTFRKEFDALIGYSDHSVGIGAAPYAVPMGAVVLEKHFTLDKSLEGPDHLASLDPVELREFVAQVRNIEVYLGISEKKPTESEMLTRKSLQKCLVAKKAIKKGEVITEDAIVAKRTGGKGISPMRYKEVVGSVSPADYKEDDIIGE
ncbi:MAG: N-acetylneuraminate synthase [Bacteroidia bacterium]|nr:N-acetylneuraminate synthase [Bacteroidia bacterium]